MSRNMVLAEDTDFANSHELWELEYREIHSIPSSTRALPSKALVMAESLIDVRQLNRVLDAGCGNGRNAIHVAEMGIEVVAADFSPIALRILRDHINSHKLSRLIHPVIIDLNRKFPFNDETFDCSLDSYVSCHFTNCDTFKSYWTELTRVTCDGGYIFTSMFSVDDEYYRSDKVIAKDKIITDRTNGITKRLYEEAEFKNLFEWPLQMADFFKFEFFDRVLGTEYKRSLLVAVLRKS